MSAAMSTHKYFLLLVFCAFLAILLEAYKLVDIEIDLNPGGEPPKIFTKESLAEFDGSDVGFKIFIGWGIYSAFAPVRTIGNRAV